MSSTEPTPYLGALIRRAQQQHVAAWQAAVPSDVTSVQYAVLAVLDRLPGASQRELGDEVDLDRSTIADLVARLERKELIERVRDDRDRRRNVLRLTAAGRAEVARLQPHVEAVQRRLATGLDAADEAHLRRLLLQLLASRG